VLASTLACSARVVSLFVLVVVVVSLLLSLVVVVVVASIIIIGLFGVFRECVAF
jgi:hypothetical protein